jgi:hypothetical protein
VDVIDFSLGSDGRTHAAILRAGQQVAATP